MFNRILLIFWIVATVAIAPPATVFAQSDGSAAGIDMEVPLPAYSLSDLKRRKCEPGAYDRSSVDCAQWKAADAAEASAGWADWTFKITVGATIVGGLTLCAAAYAAWFAKKAALETERAAKAAVEANSQTRDLFIADNRPWLKIESAEFIGMPNLTQKFLQVNVRNVGRGHALHVKMETRSPYLVRSDGTPEPVETVMRKTHSNPAHDRRPIFEGDTLALMPFEPPINDDLPFGSVALCVAYRGSGDVSIEYKTACLVEFLDGKAFVNGFSTMVI